MLSRVASRTASAASRVAPPAAAAAWSSLRGLAVSAGDDASGADDGASGEKPAGDETVLGHLLSDETSTDADDDAPHASADHPDDQPAHLDESRGVTVEAGEDLDDDDDDEDLDEDDASVSAAAAELDAALAASALARSSDPIRWYGGVEPHRPPATGRAPRSASFPLGAPAGDGVSALDASSIARFWRLSEDDAARLLPEPLPRAIADEFAASNTRRLLFRRCDLDHRVAVAAGKSILLDGASAPENPSRSRTSSRGLDRRDTSSRTFPRDARSPSIRRIRRMKRRGAGTPPSTLARCSSGFERGAATRSGNSPRDPGPRPGRRRSRRR